MNFAKKPRICTFVIIIIIIFKIITIIINIKITVTYINGLFKEVS